MVVVPSLPLFRIFLVLLRGPDPADRRVHVRVVLEFAVSPGATTGASFSAQRQTAPQGASFPRFHVRPVLLLSRASPPLFPRLFLDVEGANASTQTLVPRTAECRLLGCPSASSFENSSSRFKMGQTLPAITRRVALGQSVGASCRVGSHCARLLSPPFESTERWSTVACRANRRSSGGGIPKDCPCSGVRLHCVCRRRHALVLFFSVNGRCVRPSAHAGCFRTQSRSCARQPAVVCQPFYRLAVKIF